MSKRRAKRIVYHGTDKVFRRFSLKHATQGIIWFSSDKASIESGDAGAQGRSRILKLEVTIKKPAGWKEYDQLMLAQIKSQGYDGVILPRGDGQYDGFVFHPSQVKIVGVER